MARVGFTKAKYNVIDGTTGKFKGAPKDFEKVVDEKLATEFNSGELYGNDALQESDYSFKSGTLSITICDDDDTFIAEIMGQGVGSDTTEITQNVNDMAPYCAYGHIVPKIVGGVRKYKVEVLPKVKFTSVSTENQTRGDTTEFKTTSLEAKVYALDKALGEFAVGDWEKHQTFATLSEAETYLTKLLTTSGS